ncbi:response regulator transcription factor [Nocardiopsis rhodophaea]|uniref:Response regulator transcription factor n=1 Tax=Nocardiopsis rhodophaea TaxID=280238 RepID=A0ABN2SAA0_9ACTN
MIEATTHPHVLVIDDEPNIRELVQAALRFHNFSVSTAGTGGDGLALARERHPDLILLDIMLPDISGFEICQRLRHAGDNVPVIYLTARDTPSDTVTGLSLGGDDYVTKPFSVEALIARIHAMLRRTRREETALTEATRDEHGVLRVADLELNERTWGVRRAGVPVELSPTEFRLLAYMMNHAGRILTRAQLLENVWGWDYAGQSQIVETYVSYLRRKLDPLGPALIHTKRGVGYSIRVPKAEVYASADREADRRETAPDAPDLDGGGEGRPVSDADTGDGTGPRTRDDQAGPER